ncbi:MAG: hypothetical protein PHQ43_00190 [Dehalococcoidales bacterium]|nr:hypothetical protein [Dehalococcoidales bacterium]
MGWSYTDLCDAPHEIVEEFWQYMQTEWRANSEKAEDAEAEIRAKAKSAVRRR